MDYTRWRIDVNRADPWDEDPQFPRFDWGAEAEANETSLGYWEWVFNQRQQAADEGTAVARASKDDVLRAIASHEETARHQDHLAKELLPKNTPIYWYSQRGQNYYLQEGVVLHCNSTTTGGGREVKARNDHTGKEVWISLYDLRFWLNDVHPE